MAPAAICLAWAPSTPFVFLCPCPSPETDHLPPLEEWRSSWFRGLLSNACPDKRRLAAGRSSQFRTPQATEPGADSWANQLRECDRRDCVDPWPIGFYVRRKTADEGVIVSLPGKRLRHIQRRFAWAEDFLQNDSSPREGQQERSREPDHHKVGIRGAETFEKIGFRGSRRIEQVNNLWSLLKVIQNPERGVWPKTRCPLPQGVFGGANSDEILPMRLPSSRGLKRR